MKRLLCILSSMDTGGAETFLMKVYRNIDRSKYQIDFCINKKSKTFYEDEIIALGGRILRIPTKSDNLKAFKEQLEAIIRENEYKYVLRITSNAAGFLDLKVAKKAGAQICAVRSSNSSDGSDVFIRIAHKLGRLIYSKYVDTKIAPSKLAAQYTFGKIATRNNRVHILHNALDLAIYHFDNEGRASFRKEFCIKDEVTIFGHIGRFTSQKNHGFLLILFKRILMTIKESKLLLVGEGELEEQIAEKAAGLGILDSLIFAGVRSDIPQILSAMDVFIFPSLYEGMPNVVIEAQATGLPCIISNTITREADITGLVKYIPIGNADEWAREAIALSKGTQRRDTKKDLVEHHYEIKSVVDDFTGLIFEKE